MLTKAWWTFSASGAAARDMPGVASMVESINCEMRLSSASASLLGRSAFAGGAGL